MKNLTRILLVEDNPKDAAIIRTILSKKESMFTLEVAVTGEKALEMMNKSLPDLVLLDYNLPGINGLAVLEQIRRHEWRMPVVMLTGAGDGLIAAEAIKQGADDYVAKDDKLLSTLVPLIQQLQSEGTRAYKRNETFLPSEIHLLYVEDNIIDAELIQKYFGKNSPHIHMTWISDSTKVIGMLKSGVPIDCALLDLRLIQTDAIALMREIEEKGYKIPFVVVTGNGNEESAVAAMKLGAYDYISKNENYISKLPYAIEMAVMKFRKDAMNQRLQRELVGLNESLEQKVHERTVALTDEIVERIKAQELLQNERKLLRTVIDNIPDSIYIKDLASRKILSNVTDVQFIGAKSEAEVLGKNDFDVYPKELAEKFYADDQAMIQTGAPVLNKEKLIYNKKKQERWVLSSKLPLRDKDNQIIGLVGISHDITEQKQAEMELRASEMRYKNLLDTARDIIFTISTEGTITSLNSAFETVTGLSRSEWIGKNIGEGLVHPDDWPRAGEIVRRTVLGEIPRLTEVRILSKSGEYLVGEFIMSPQFRDGKVTEIMGIGRDITERKRSEESLRESEKQYRGLFENMVEGFAYCQMIFENGKPKDILYLSVNKMFETLTGLKDVTGKYISQVIPGIQEADPELFAIYARVSQTGISERFEMFVTAMKMWFSISVYSPKKGFFVAVFDVITERKQAEELLRESEDRFRDLYENAPNTYFSVGKDGRILRCNNKVHTLLGYDPDKLIGMPISELYANTPDGKEKSKKILQKFLSGEKINDEELQMQKADGTVVWISLTVNAVFNAQREITESRSMVVDISERKQAQKALAESESLYRTLAEAAQDFITLINRDMIIEYTNSFAAHLFK
ncbi:MAG: PAS domain S-box protein, partial [Bacteroidota bacterium]|nr:PAS domain S-box protein [Bacteroidota bacterium]